MNKAERVEKKCSQCKVVKPLEEFARGFKYSPDGRGYECRECRSDNKLKKKYGLTKQQNELLYEEQEGKCCICKRFFLRKNLVVDHNHTTGKVRGLLCSPCNRGIGLLGDNIENLFRAQQYLMRENPDQGDLID